MNTDHAAWHVPLPLDGGTLELSPRWLQFAESWQSVLFLVASLVPLLLILAIYRYELRLVRRGFASLLLGLRVLFFLILWMLICLQPVLAHVSSERLPSRVAVAIDVSPSTTVADPQRSVAEKLHLARGLKLFDNSLRPAVDAWIAHHEKHGSEGKPSFASERERSEYDRLCREVEGLRRREIGRLLLDRSGLNLLERLGRDHQVDVIAFDQTARDVNRERFDELFSDNDQAAGSTDLRTPLQQAPVDSSAGKLLGIVLLSDGRHTVDESPLGLTKTPIYPVMLGARRAPPDLAVVDIKAPRSVFKDAEAGFEVQLRAIDIAAQDLTVELRKKGEATPLESKVVKHDGTSDRHHVQFFQQMKEAGVHEYEVAVRARDGTREITAKNNVLPALVRVADDRARVLLIDGEARWEYHFIAMALLRDETVELERIVFRQPTIGKLSGADLDKLQPMRKLPEPKDTDPLLDFDCIILGDVAPEDLPPADRTRLEKYVSERGGTLIVVAGKRYMPMAYADDKEDPLAKALPIAEPSVVNPTAGFPLKFTHEGSVTPFLQLDPLAERNTLRWSKMMPHYWGAIGRLKPGAISLAYHDDAAGGKPDEQVLFAQHNYGFGRVLYLGVDSTWRWRFRAGDAYHHRFWGQVVRWAAADAMLPAGDRIVRYGTPEAVYREGQAVEVLVRLNADAPALPKDARAVARLLRSDDQKEVALLNLTPNESQPRLLQGSISSLPHGAYRIDIELPHIKEKPDAKAATFTVAPGPQREFADLSANWELLDELATNSGGRFFTPENVEQLVDLFARQITIREHRAEQKLWQDAPLVWWVLAVLLLLVTAEWVIRKMVALP